MIHIIDDILPVDVQDSIEKFLLESDWKFSRTIAYKNHSEVSEEQKQKIMGFTHIVLKDEKIFDDNINLYCEPLIASVKHIGKELVGVFNIRAQLQLPTPSSGYGSVHVDSHLSNSYKVCLYYVNDSDGDTILFKERSTNTTSEQIKNGLYEEHFRIQPKRGRFVIFDGDVYHCGSKPTKDVRLVINYNVFLNG